MLVCTDKIFSWRLSLGLDHHSLLQAAATASPGCPALSRRRTGTSVLRATALMAASRPALQGSPRCCLLIAGPPLEVSFQNYSRLPRTANGHIPRYMGIPTHNLHLLAPCVYFGIENCTPSCSLECLALKVEVLMLNERCALPDVAVTSLVPSFVQGENWSRWASIQEGRPRKLGRPLAFEGDPEDPFLSVEVCLTTVSCTAPKFKPCALHQRQCCRWFHHG